MKKTLLFVCAALLTSGAWAQKIGDVITVGSTKYNVVGENLVANGSFENGVDGWKTTSYGADAIADNFVLSAEGGYDGGAYVTTSAGGKGAVTSLMQSIAVEEGKTYVFTCYTSGTAPASNNLQYHGLWAATEEGDHENGKICDLAWGDATSWKLNQKDFTATTGYVNIRFSWNTNSSFDGISLVEVEEAGIDLTAYNAEVQKAQAQLAGYEEGTDWYTALSEAIATATATTPTTVEEANAAVQALQAAETAATNAEKISHYAKIEAGKYYVLNVEAGKFLSNGANWGTRSVLADQGIEYTVEVGNDGKYTLKSGIKGDTKALRPSDGFNDQSGAWEIFPAENGVYMYNGSQYFCNAENCIPTFSAEKTAGCVWQFVTADERKALLAEASAQNPVDATVFIKGADFLNGDAANAAWSENKVGGDFGSGCTIINSSNNEKWNAGVFDVYQVVEGLPNGIYTISCQGFTRLNGTTAASADSYEACDTLPAYLYAGEQQVALKSIFAEADTEAKSGWSTVTSTAGNQYVIANGQNTAAVKFDEGAYVNVIENVVVTDGTLRLGVKSEGGIEWVVFDTFRLTYYGEESTEPAAPTVTVGDIALGGENVEIESANDINVVLPEGSDYDYVTIVVNKMVWNEPWWEGDEGFWGEEEVELVVDEETWNNSTKNEDGSWTATFVKQPQYFQKDTQYTVRVIMAATNGDTENWWNYDATRVEFSFTGTSEVQEAPELMMGFAQAEEIGTVAPDEFAGVTITFPSNNIEEALGETPSFQYGALALQITDAYIYEVDEDGNYVGDPVASVETVESQYTWESVTAFDNDNVRAALKPNTTYVAIIAGIELFDQMEWEPVWVSGPWDAVFVEFTTGVATGIEKNVTIKDTKIYDMNGRLQNKLQKGINIVNGAKVLVK